jgi:hypothetical protein
MIFLKLFAFTFFAYGLTNIVVFGRGPFGICDAIRRISANISDGLGKLFTCPMCFSTWVGAGTSLVDLLLLKGIAFTPFNVVFCGLSGFWVGLLIVLLDSFLTSGLVWIIHQFEEALERHGLQYSVDYMEEEEENDGR